MTTRSQRGSVDGRHRTRPASVGTYPSEAATRADYNVAKDLHAVDAAGIYDAAVITKDSSGKVHVNRTRWRRGTEGGAALPPVRCSTCISLRRSLVPRSSGARSTRRAATCGGISRSDVKELGEHGELIDEGQAALLVIGASTLGQALESNVEGRAAGRQAGRREHGQCRRGGQGRRQPGQLTESA